MWDRLVDGSVDAWCSQQKGCPAQPCFGDTERGCVPAETPCLEDPRGRGWFLCSPPELNDNIAALQSSFRSKGLPVFTSNWIRRPDDGLYGAFDRFYGPT